VNHARLRNKFDRLAEIHANSAERDKDPVSFIIRYSAWQDREIAGFIASCLAYGRVETILKSVDQVLSPLGKRPSVLIASRSFDPDGLYAKFSHRLNKGSDIRLLLLALRTVLIKYGSLKELFASSLRSADRDFLAAQDAFIRTLRTAVFAQSAARKIPLGRVLHLLPSPSAGSACKRLNLFFKWMIRKDAIDPGVWLPELGHLQKSLIIPLDTHIAKAGRRYAMTARKSNDIRTAVEITAFLSKLCPGDPLAYDFSLCHDGMTRHRGKKPSVHPSRKGRTGR